MDLSLNADQIAILDALDSLAKPYEAVPIGDHSCAQGGFLDVAFDPDLGTVTAAIIVERLARLPHTTEAAMTALVRPLLGNEINGPLCPVQEGKRNRMLRFLKPGATVVMIGEHCVCSMAVTAEQVRAEPESLYGYPMGTLLVDLEGSLLIAHQASPKEAITRWRVALAAEAAGLLAGALQSVCDHVSQREQFGRALAAFQAVRHRLAEAQVRTNGVYWLAIKAAATLDAADAALAALHAQESIKATVYDFHQFLGAMGMTLEHPLHLWTYRLKALSSELGGRGANAIAAADALWG
jgi:Acyl-CoA dehydrogenase, C-terminal domain